VDVHTSAIHYQGHEATMAVTRDITPLKKVQDMLRERNERLLESNAALEEYARVASHDLQEPLRKIENFCEILQEDYADALDEEGQQYLRILVRSAGRMRKLIKDVLAFSRAGSEERPLEEVDLGEVLSSVCENLSARIEDKHAEIVYDTLPTVRADRTQMLQLFQNLISNALKFNEQDVPRVVIQSRALAQEWVITVSDNGIGMKEWELRYIFVPFKRLHNRNKYDGTGIGLAVCRRNIHRHGGTINVASEPGKGSVFTITLPRPAPGTPLSHETDKTEEVTS
jgi:light-regulated signal transduction histidine kinase (bacteriophytochrome)